jgi:hypothetical protein
MYFGRHLSSSLAVAVKDPSPAALLNETKRKLAG